MPKSDSRNKTVDTLRGVAMLMVVMGHTMTGCVQGAEETLLDSNRYTRRVCLGKS